MRFGFLILFSLRLILVFAQPDQTDFIHYASLQGFTDDNVTCITQDRYGFIWVGTSHGLNRFDGKNVKTFKSDNKDGSLLSDEIVRLDWADSTQLLVSTKFGLHIINIRTFQQRNIIIPAGPVGVDFKVNIIHNLFSDQRGHFYIVTRSGLYHFNQQWELQFRYDDFEASTGEYSGGFGVASIQLDDQHILLVGQHGYFKYATIERKMNMIMDHDPDFIIYNEIIRLKERNYALREFKQGHYLLFINDSDSIAYIDEISNRVIYSHLPFFPAKKEITWRSKIFHVQDSTYWMTGQSAGIFKLSVNEATGVVRVDTLKSFNAYFCNTIFTDKEQHIWIGTNGGLFMQHQRLVNIEFGNLPASVSGNLSKPAFIQFSSDQNYVYAVGTKSGGVFKFRKNDLHFEEIIPFNFPEYSNKTIRSIVHWNADTLICGSHNGVLWFDIKNRSSGLIHLPGWNLKHNWCSELFIDSQHRLWVLGNLGSACIMCENGITNCHEVSVEKTVADKLNEIYHIAEDREGNMWLAGAGVARYGYTSHGIDFYSRNFPSLPDDSEMIPAIAFDRAGGMWFGNATNGLVYFNSKTNDTIVFTEKDGLPDRLINAITTDDQFVWVSCRSGIARIDIEQHKMITAINKTDIYAQTISSNKFYFDNLTSEYYLGLGDKLMRFRPEDLKAGVDPPRLMIENVAFGNDSVWWKPPMEINTDWNHRDLTLTIGAVNFHDPDDQFFSYRVRDNTDTTWIELGQQRKLFFSSLSARGHEVDIKVSSSNHRWPDQSLRFKMNVQPPFWKSWWFYSLWVIFVFTAGYTFFKYRINQLKKVILIRERISQDLHDEVGATLSGIAMYSYLTKEQLKTGRTDEMENSLNVIQQSSTEMVTKLNDIIWAVDPQHDSLHKLVQRLEEYAMEVGSTKSIRVNVVVPKDLEQIKVPMKARRNVYLICKEAINNAVKYSDSSVIELTVSVTNHALEFVIKDNGIGFDPLIIKRGNGLDNMQKRADDIGGKFNLTSTSQNGTNISIIVSLEE